jgi:hypothetical protein
MIRDNNKNGTAVWRYSTFVPGARDYGARSCYRQLSYADCQITMRDRLHEQRQIFPHKPETAI